MMKKDTFLLSPRNKTERGQSLVEFAISALLLIMLLAGAVDFGIALYSYVSLRDAAQEGALFASINPDETTDIISRIRSSSSSPVDLSDTSTVIINIDYSSANHCEGSGDTVTIDVSMDYELIMPLIPDILGVDTIPLSATATNAILQPACP